RMSRVPPGGNGTTNRMGFVGKSAATLQDVPTVSSATSDRRCNLVMAPPPISRCLHKVRRHQLGRDALGFRGGIVQLDLDAIGVEEEQLEQRLPVCSSLSERHLLGAQMLQHLPQAGGAERDVVDR